MKRYYLIPLLELLLIFSSCSSSKEEQSKEFIEARNLYSQSIEIHDEVMVLMSEMGRVGQKLNHKMDSIAADSLNSELINDYMDAQGNLQKASESMMDWMRNLERLPEEDNNLTQDSLKKIISVQEKQHQDIRKVSEAMQTSLANGKRLLKSNP